MEKSELSTRDRMCSVAGGMASQLVDREIPSQLIPFCGIPVCRCRREPDGEIGTGFSTLSVEERIKERRF